ncbi:MAG: protein-glutamate methylesterase/protein-glutamine glutaminase [Bacillota bacterium]
MIKVLIVDDSKSIRDILQKIIETSKDMKVVAKASNPYEAVKLLKKYNPDVITLDIEMPGMSGIDFLKRLMNARPTPVVMISSLTQKGADATIRALDLGAIDFVPKKRLNNKLDKKRFMREVKMKVKNASLVNVSKHKKETSKNKSSKKRLAYNKKIILIGASTGGVQSIKKMIQKFPSQTPPILIVQHMPKFFTKSFANSLDNVSNIKVKEAKNLEIVKKNTAYIAPGDYHMGVAKEKGKFKIKINQHRKVNRHRPSVDYTFHSIKKHDASKTIGILLTGMGDDGARGMKYLKNNGATTIAESEKTAIIFGMPQKAIQLNAVDHVVDLDKISSILF